MERIQELGDCKLRPLFDVKWFYFLLDHDPTNGDVKNATAAQSGDGCILSGVTGHTNIY